jgi:phage baseplate assembly protein W
MTDQIRGLLVPFRRDRKRDFASGTGRDLLGTKVLQALMTAGATPRSSGELPWRTSFGAGLDLLRHQRNDVALAELARVQVRDALKRWVPEAELVEVRVTREDATLMLRVRYRPARRAGEATDQPAEVALPIGT